MELIVLASLRAGNYVLIAVGFALVFGSLRILNLMHGSFVMLGAYGTYFFIAALTEESVAGLPSGSARARSAAKTGDVIAACYLLALHRLEERNVLRRTFSARNEIVCELVHDQMGPMLARWAENLRGGWPDSVSSLVALSGGPPITVADDWVLKGPFGSLAWRGCTVQPHMKRLIFESSVFEDARIRIPADSKAWCCSADAKSYSMPDVDDVDWGRLTTAEPNNFVPRPAGQS